MIKVTDTDKETSKTYNRYSDISDGYHTFAEIYRYRMLYNALLFNEWAKKGLFGVCKSKRHSDGEPCFGGDYFVVYAKLPTGQFTNHYKLKYWNLFDIPEVERAPRYDGHTPDEGADRMEKFLKGEW